jgi:hypothetical protein
MRKLLAIPALLALAACSSTTRVGGRADHPLAVVYAEYAVPIALGQGLAGSVGGWDEGVSLKGFIQGFTHRPRTNDTDRDFVNYGLHPLSGSETHMIARNYGWDFAEALLFDAAASISWEYVFENVYERPSRTDLLVTAPVGALLGELRYQMKKAGILPWLVDPVGDHGRPFIELGTDGLFLVGLERRF